MASENPGVHNNQDFQLSEIFNVKDKVAVVTGEHRQLSDTVTPND